MRFSLENECAFRSLDRELARSMVLGMESEVDISVFVALKDD